MEVKKSWEEGGRVLLFQTGGVLCVLFNGKGGPPLPPTKANS